MFSILLIVLVIIVLFVFTAAFSQAVNDLVVRPLEKMMTTLRSSALLMIKSVEQLSSVKEKEDPEFKKKVLYVYASASCLLLSVMMIGWMR
jgi:hypothetical protein